MTAMTLISFMTRLKKKSGATTQNGPGVSEEAKILHSVIYVCKLNIYIFCMQQISQIHLKNPQVWRAAGVICGASVCAGDGFSFPPDFRGHPYRLIPNTVR